MRLLNWLRGRRRSITDQRPSMADHVSQDAAYERIVDLCRRFGTSHDGQKVKAFDGTDAYRIKVAELEIWLYEDGAGISRSAQTPIDQRYEIYDYPSASELFRVCIRDFFDIAFNGPLPTSGDH